MEKTPQKKQIISISAVVPCYNCMDVLDRAVKSLVSQEKTDAIWDIILVDDGSTDGTGEECDRYAQDHSNLKVVHKKNGGLVSAWKAGVEASDGDYIVFCDSDDYVDTDLLKSICPIVKEYTPDVILYGLIMEYANSTKQQYGAHKLGGYYDREAIENVMLPLFFSNGEMQSNIIPCMRVCKAFKRDPLLRVLPDVPEVVSTGEDRITTFSMIMQCKSLYVMKDYYPYHYVRTDDSMIGGYDPERFIKLSLYFDALEQTANKYHYEYHGQISAEVLSLYFLYMKKEIERNPNDYRVVRSILRQERRSLRFKNALEETDISRYQRKAKVFAWLMIHEWYGVAYYLVKLSKSM